MYNIYSPSDFFGIGLKAHTNRQYMISEKRRYSNEKNRYYLFGALPAGIGVPDGMCKAGNGSDDFNRLITDD